MEREEETEEDREEGDGVRYTGRRDRDMHTRTAHTHARTQPASQTDRPPAGKQAGRPAGRARN